MTEESYKKANIVAGLIGKMNNPKQDLVYNAIIMELLFGEGNVTIKDIEGFVKEADEIYSVLDEPEPEIVGYGMNGEPIFDNSEVKINEQNTECAGELHEDQQVSEMPV